MQRFRCGQLMIYLRLGVDRSSTLSPQPSTAAERTWHIQDSQGRILKTVEGVPFSLEADPGSIPDALSSGVYIYVIYVYIYIYIYIYVHIYIDR